MDVIARTAVKAKLMIFLVLGLVIASLTAINSPGIVDSVLPQSKAHADTMISYPSVHAKSASSSREEMVSPAIVSSTRAMKQSCFAPELFPIDLETRKPNCRFSPESISDGMCLRSITNNGDESRFLPVLEKIQSRQCITILVFGGSISNGNCRSRSNDPDKPLGTSEAWLPRLEYILNARYPCNGQHSVINYAMSNRGTDHHFQTMRRADTQKALASADIVIMEASVNDVASAYHLKSFGKGLGVRSNMLQFWTEATIRLLRGKFPHLALLWVEASTRAWKGQSEAGKLRAPYRSDASADHLEVLQYYDIPQIDVMRALGAGGLPLEQEFRTECYFCDFVHPTRYGQNITASIVASAFDRMLEHTQSQHIVQRYRKADNQDLSDLPDPLTMTQKLDDAMRSEDITRVTLDTQESFDKHVVGAESRNGAPGWSFDTDMEGKPKTAMTVKSGSCVTVELGFSSRVSLLSFELFHSYNNVGTALVKLLERCAATKDAFVALGGVEKLKLRWHDQVSIGVERFIDHDFSKLGHNDCAKFVSVCAKNDNGSSKVKLYSVFASSAFQR